MRNLQVDAPRLSLAGHCLGPHEPAVVGLDMSWLAGRSG